VLVSPSYTILSQLQKKRVIKKAFLFIVILVQQLMVIAKRLMPVLLSNCSAL
jgi:hypothetical protein